MVRYFSLYATAQRGKIRKAGATSKLLLIKEECPKIPRRGWAKMIRKVYEIYPLLFPSCGGKMSIISFIKEPKTIDRIIPHLKLTLEAERPPPPHVAYREILVAAEAPADYFS